MIVCSYNYRLQWLYDQDMSSGINARFCAYCAHSTGIDTPLHNMHDNEVIKVYVWLVLEEVRAHQSVMAWGMVFGVLVPEVGASGLPINIEVSLAGAIPDPVVLHVNSLQPFLLDVIVCKTHCCGVIYLHGSGGW